MATTDAKFSDLDFDLAITADGDIKAETNNDAIKQSMLSILLTSPGERVMKPEFGCDLRGLLFNPFDEITARSIGNVIKNSLTNFEPRINLQEVLVITNYDDQVYEAEIEYSIVNQSGTESLKVILQRL